MSGAARTPVAGAGSIVTFQPGDLLLAASDVDDRNIDLRNHRGPGRILHDGAAFDRSEEHTSALQSLMRTSTAVFCLTTNKQPTSNITQPLTHGKSHDTVIIA